MVGGGERSIKRKVLEGSIEGVKFVQQFIGKKGKCVVDRLYCWLSLSTCFSVNLKSSIVILFKEKKKWNTF